MYISLLFWLALLLPGYALVRRLRPETAESGLLGVVGVSYVATLGLLSPVSILCYVWHAPVAVFSGACAILIVLAAVDIARLDRWRALAKLVVGALSIELVILLADMVLGGAVGGMTGGDAPVHLARIRSLLDHGFNNFDPFVGPPYFFPIYHTNIYHALHAACSQLTGVHYMSVWYASLPWAKLLVASGAYYLAWSVFGRRWPAWIAAVFTVGCQGPVIFLIYPNKIAPLWLLPMMIGFAIQALNARTKWSSAISIGVGSLLLGQIHALYAAFAGLILGPALVVSAVWHLAKRRSQGVRIATCALALTAALPFLLISQRETKYGNRPATASAPGAGHKAFHHFGDGTLALHPRFGWGLPRNAWQFTLTGCVLVGAGLSLAGRRRRQAATFLAMIATAAILLFTPTLCAWLLRIFGREWIVARMGVVFQLAFVVLVPAAVAYFIEPWTRRWWVRSIISLVALAAALPFAPHKKPYRWQDYWVNATAPERDRHRYLTTGKIIREFLEENVPPGETLLTDQQSGTILAANHDCYVVAPRNSSNGVPDLAQRRLDLTVMLAEDTPWPRRRALLRKYKITFFRPDRPNVRWPRGHVKEVRRGRTVIIVLDTDH